MINSIKLFGDSLWEPELQGHYYCKSSNVFFIYRSNNSLCELCINTGSMRIITTLSNLSLPNKWQINSDRGSTILHMGNGVAIDIEKQVLISSAEQIPLQNEYEAPISTFKFNRFEISIPKDFSYICKYDGLDYWKFVGRGYLYTRIEKWYDTIFWGTDGMGGYFYALDINSGIPKASIRTMGTSVIMHNGCYCFLLCRKKNSTELIRVSLCSGDVTRISAVDGIPTPYSSMAFFHGILYFTTFSRKQGQTICMNVHAVDIGEYLDLETGLCQVIRDSVVQSTLLQDNTESCGI